jgi:hypothetical protein
LDEAEKNIAAVINGSGLPVTAEPQAVAVASQATNEVAAAIERACEATLARMYESVEQNEKMVSDQRRKVDDFATVLRKYYKAHVGSLGEFMAHLQRTTDELDAHVRGFEERLQAGVYPRAGDD